jgi:hypothetical protein
MTSRWMHSFDLVGLFPSFSHAREHAPLFHEQCMRLWELQLYSPIVAVRCCQGIIVVVMEQKVALYR